MKTSLSVSELTTVAAVAGALPSRLVNNTGAYPNRDIHLYVVGTELTSRRQGFARADGVFVPCELAHNGPDGYADFAIPLAPSGETPFLLPPNMCGRIYVSIDGKLRFQVVPGAGRPALRYPAGWVDSDPNYPVLHDFVEFTHNDLGIFCNTTAVDQFSVPMSVATLGAGHKVSGTLKAGARDRIFAQLAAQPGFNRLVLGRLRVIAPGHGIDAGRFSPTFYDPYVNAVWSRMASHPVTVSTDAGSFRGQVTGGRLTFDGGVAPIARPSTRDIFFCDGTLAAPDDLVSGPVAAIVGASFNRSTLHATCHQPARDPATFYKHALTNHYSRLLHENSEDGRAYGFGFDDVAGLAPVHHEAHPRSFTVRLTAFGTRV